MRDDVTNPGLEGGKRLAAALLECFQDVRMVIPSADVNDLRGWFKAGLTHEKLIDLVNDAEVYQPGPVDTAVKVESDMLSMYPWTDAGAGEMFAKVCGGLFRHVKGMGWYFYDGRRYNKKRGEKEARRFFVTHVARRLRDEALLVPPEMRDRLEKYARRLESTSSIDHALKEAQCISPIAAEPDDFDSDRLAFNCLNGVLNLKNRTFRDHSPEDNFTQLANVVYDPNATCSLWDSFMQDTFQGNQRMIDLVHRWFGHCLTGDISEHNLVIGIGDGGNGKNVLLDSVCGMMSDYACESAPDLIMASNRSHPTELADLMGKRLVVCSEPEKNSELKISSIKRQTGNARIKARFMRQDFIEFDRTHKLFLVTNNRPIIKEDTNAVWRRIRLIPFNYIVPEHKIDRKLTDKLRLEYPGILNRLLAGCLDWQKKGLDWPEEVNVATNDYHESQNPLLEFFEENCVFGNYCRVSVTRLWDVFRDWRAEEKAFGSMSRREFNESVTFLGLTKETQRYEGKVCKCWIGIGLQNNNIDDEIPL